MIKFACSHCGKSIRVDKKHAGKKGKCPKCQKPVVVPQRSTVITFHCDGCGRKIKVPDRYAGKKGKCPKCKEPVVVPATQAESVAESAAAAIACAMCGQAVAVAEESAKEAVECSGCGRMVDPSSGSVVSWPEEAVPGALDEDLEEEPPGASETAGGLDRRRLTIIGGVAVIVVVGVIAVFLFLRLSGSGQTPPPVRPRPRHDVAQTEPQPEPVVDDMPPAEEATPPEASAGIDLRFRPDPGARRTMRVTTRLEKTSRETGEQSELTNVQSFTVDLEAGEARADGTVPIEVTLAAIRVKTVMDSATVGEYDSAGPESEGDSLAGFYVPFIGKRFTISVSEQGEIIDPGLDELFLAAAADRIAAEDAMMREQLQDRAGPAIERTNQRFGSREGRVLELKNDLEEFPLFGAGDIRHLLSHLLVALPGTPVETGTQWNAPVAVLVGKRLEIPGVYTAIAIEEDPITIEGEGTRDLEAEPFIYELGDTVFSNKLGGSTLVRLTVDRRAGWLLAKEQTTRLSGRVLRTSIGTPGRESFSDESMEITTTVEPVE